MSHPKVAIIILNWNGWENTIRCLVTVLQSNYPNFEIILIDNGSTDGSLQKIREWVDGKITFKPKFITDQNIRPGNVIEIDSSAKVQATSHRSLLIVKSPVNLGFSGGCNLGMKMAFAHNDVEFCGLLNNDAEIDPNYISELTSAMVHDEKIGSCQPKMFLMQKENCIDAVGIKMRFVIALQEGYLKQDTGQYSQPKDIFGACGGAALYRKKMLEQIGLFDEDFFAYYEDVDLCLRAQLAGWRTRFVPTAIVYHFHSASLGEFSARKIYLLTRNRFSYVIKNFPLWTIIVFLITYPALIVLLCTGWMKKKLNVLPLFVATLQGTWSGILRMPGSWTKRKIIQKTNFKSYDNVLKWIKS